MMMLLVARRSLDKETDRQLGTYVFACVGLHCNVYKHSLKQVRAICEKRGRHSLDKWVGVEIQLAGFRFSGR